MTRSTPGDHQARGLVKAVKTQPPQDRGSPEHDSPSPRRDAQPAAAIATKATSQSSVAAPVRNPENSPVLNHGIALADRVAHSFSRDLTSFLNEPAVIRILKADVIAPPQWSSNLVFPAFVATTTVRREPTGERIDDEPPSAEANLTIHCESTLAIRMIHHMLGDIPQRNDSADRMLTPIESRLLRRVIDRFGDRWAGVLASPSPIDCGRIIHRHENPGICLIPGMDPVIESFVRISMSCTFAGTLGQWTCFLPAVLLATSEIPAPPPPSPSGEIEVEASIATGITLPDELQAGTVLPLTENALREATVRMDGAPCWRASLGTHDGRKAVQLHPPKENTPTEYPVGDGSSDAH